MVNELVSIKQALEDPIAKYLSSGENAKVEIPPITIIKNQNKDMK